MKLIQTLTPAQIITVYNIINGNEDLVDHYDLYNQLFIFYGDEMPYGTQKAKDGDPFNWITLALKRDMPKQVSSEEVNDLVCDAHEQNDSNPHYRYGQALFNILYERHPELADAIRTTAADPFYNNNKVELFLKTITA